MDCPSYQLFFWSLPCLQPPTLVFNVLDISNELNLFSFVKNTQKPLSLSFPVFGLKHILQWTRTHVGLPITLTWKFCRIYSQSLKKRNNSYSLPQIAMAWNDSLLLISEKDIFSPLYMVNYCLSTNCGKLIHLLSFTVLKQCQTIFIALETWLMNL